MAATTVGREQGQRMNCGDDGLFDVGPTGRLSGWLRWRKLVPDWALSPAIMAALVSWLPLALLAAWRGSLIGPTGPGPFLRDIAAHARYLIAVPLLVLAQPGCIARLEALARHFTNSGLVADCDHERFRALTASIARVRHSFILDVALIVLAYAIVAAAFYSISPQHLPAWSAAALGGKARFSPAGWWHLLVSLPLLLLLVLDWLCRLLLWTRFVWSMSRFNLRLLPAHPDRAAGLLFTCDSINAQTPFALALSTIAAGMIANRVIYEGATLPSFMYLVIGLIVTLLVLLVAPLLTFAGNLVSAWERGVLEYDALADHAGREFERNWIGRSQSLDESPLHTQAFSALTDLFALVRNVNTMRFIPIEARNLIYLVVMTLLPFLPLVLTAVPLNVVLKDFVKFLI